jgi:hypothetical protein
MHAKHPRIAERWEEHTPASARLPERAKKAYAHGRIDALAKFGLSTTGEELRLKIPNRTFHGYDAALKSESDRNAKKAEDADLLAQAFDAMPTPRSPLDQVTSRDPLDRSTAWGAPSSLSAGDTANRLSDMGQNTAVGTAFGCSTNT